MKTKDSNISPHNLIKYFFLSISSLAFFVVYKSSSGFWFLNGFMFALNSLGAFATFMIILFSYYNFGAEVWKMRVYIYTKIPRYFADTIGLILVISSIYLLVRFSMVFSLYILRYLGLDPLQGYAP